MSWKTAWLTVVLVCCYGTAKADEPNETFAQATVFAPGVLSVDDVIGTNSESGPDTMVASLNTAGFIISENNDGGPWEGSLGSGLAEIPINNDSSFWFIVTGYPDFNYSGDHSESGPYRVYVDIYNDFGEYEESYQFNETLEPGEVDQFYLDGFNTFYSYDVFIDNTTGGDVVDFFTFTGLAAGDTFSAEVKQQVSTGFDSILGWFDEAGTLILVDDDGGVGDLSRVTGIVPSSGTLTFAVSGYDDFDFEGLHGEQAEYTLNLTLNSGASGDFDSDGDVDGRDFLTWQRNPGVGSLTDWQTNYGGVPLAAAAVVPEPTALLLLIGVGTAYFCAPRKFASSY